MINSNMLFKNFNYSSCNSCRDLKYEIELPQVLLLAPEKGNHEIKPQ